MSENSSGKNKKITKKEEAKTVLLRLEGTKWLMFSLLCGAGLRLMECLGL